MGTRYSYFVYCARISALSFSASPASCALVAAPIVSTSKTPMAVTRTNLRAPIQRSNMFPLHLLGIGYGQHSERYRPLYFSVNAPAVPARHASLRRAATSIFRLYQLRKKSSIVGCIVRLQA